MMLSYLESQLMHSGPKPSTPFSFFIPASGVSLPLIDVRGRNVILPALFSFRDTMALLALSSSSHTMFCREFPRAVSIAVS